MDVFKTHVGEGKALMINEENFYLATRERKPYVVDSGGVKSFYAVCPECDNPIQLIGLMRRQQDSLPIAHMGGISDMTCRAWPYMTRTLTCPVRSPIPDIGERTGNASRPIRPARPCTGS